MAAAFEFALTQTQMASTEESPELSQVIGGERHTVPLCIEGRLENGAERGLRSRSSKKVAGQAESLVRRAETPSGSRRFAPGTTEN